MESLELTTIPYPYSNLYISHYTSTSTYTINTVFNTTVHFITLPDEQLQVWHFFILRHPAITLVTTFYNPDNLTNDILILKSFDNKQIISLNR